MLEKNIGPPTEAMHTKVTHGERFSMDKNPQISHEIKLLLLECLKH